MTKKHVHICGVAGVGMNALAQALVFSGYSVSGSDRFIDRRRALPVLEKLRALGITLVPQDGSGVTEETDCVVFSTAVENNNPDLLRARAMDKPIRHRAKMLADLAEGKSCIAIAGTCGKTTTTGMTGWILEAAGLDPFVVNGGAVLNWRDEKSVGNVRPGKSGLWVVEVDESDRSLLEFSPDTALITNIAKDHFNLEETEALFRKFAGQVKKNTLGCFGTPSRDDILKDFHPRLSAGKIEFEYHGVEFLIPQIGRHNAENAVMAVALCETLGVNPDTACKALREFKGIERRLEYTGRTCGIDVIDDYAHNPAKIGAAWQAVSGYYKNIYAVWRPHGYRPLRTMMDELVELLPGIMRPGDKLYLLPVFDAGGTAERSVQSDELADSLKKRNVTAEYIENYEQLAKKLISEAKAGGVILVMGARDPELPVFAETLPAKLCCQ